MDLSPKTNMRRMSCRPWSANNKWRVLALLDTTGVGPNLVPLISLQAQLNALKVLAAAPADLTERLDLYIKVHPFYQDLEIVAAAGKDLLKRVLPPKADLHELISEASLVVAVNYVGSALVHVLRAGRPLLYLLTEHEPMLKRPDRSFDIFMERLPSSGPQINSGPQSGIFFRIVQRPSGCA